MGRYRYETSVLTGPWRDSEADALKDAVSAGQAVISEDGRIAWITNGAIARAQPSWAAPLLFEGRRF